MARFAIAAIGLAMIISGGLPVFGASVPQLLDYQGFLASSTGSPLDTVLTIQFVIYNDSLAGTPLWQQSFTDVSITAGRFQVLLGSDGSLDDSVFSGSNRFLGITVGGDAEMAPRTRIVSVPYCLRSSTVVDNVLLVGAAADTVRLDPAAGVVLRATDAAGNQRITLRANDTALCIYGSDGLLRVRIGIEGAAAVGAGNVSEAAPRIAGGGAVSLYGVEGAGGIAIYRSAAAARGTAESAAEEPVLRITENGDIYGKGQVVMGTNSAGADWGTVFGYNNVATGDSATVSGGYENSATGYVSTISGGSRNSAGGDWSMAGGGYLNRVDGQASFVGGGIYNAVDTFSAAGYSSILGGSGNTIDSAGRFASICGGSTNKAKAEFSYVAGGLYNVNKGELSTILTGDHCTIDTAARRSLVWGRNVYLNSPSRIALFGGTWWDGFVGINRDDSTGGIYHPLHVGWRDSNGNGAHLTADGMWTNASSRTFKTDFKELDGRELLENIASIPVESWRYKGTQGRHIGPVAEDFAHTFGVGSVREGGTIDDHYLAASDVAGVSLAAVQELYRQNQEQRRELAELRALVEQLLTGSR